MARIRDLALTPPHHRPTPPHHRQVMAHPFFGGLDWAGLRAGVLPPPITPSIDAVHAGSIAEVGVRVRLRLRVRLSGQGHEGQGWG